MSSTAPRLADLLRMREAELTPAEARVAQALLQEYPVAGLGTVASLARRAGVSDPTVVRFVAKLGFAGGYPEFQRALLQEVEARLHSPLLMMEARAPGGTAGTYLRSVEASLAEARQRESEITYTRAAALLADRKLRVTLLGGRFSRYLAGIFHTHLRQLRPNVRHLDGTAAELVDALIDIDKQDLLLVFDYRRYQADVVDFARQAAARGAKLVLFTDPYKSPVAELAQLVFTAPVAADSPYDTMIPALAQIEALLACLLEHRGRDMRERLEELEALRDGRGITLG